MSEGETTAHGFRGRVRAFVPARLGAGFRRQLDDHEQWLHAQRERMDKLDHRDERQAARLAHQETALNKLRQRLKELEEKTRPAVAAQHLAEVDVHRMTSQVGALEERLGRLEQVVSDGRLITDDESTAEARRLLDAVRVEHEQVRVRMQIVSSYEERLRRLETALVALTERDLRDPV